MAHERTSEGQLPVSPFHNRLPERFPLHGRNGIRVIYLEGIFDPVHIRCSSATGMRRLFRRHTEVLRKQSSAASDTDGS